MFKSEHNQAAAAADEISPMEVESAATGDEQTGQLNISEDEFNHHINQIEKMEIGSEGYQLMKSVFREAPHDVSN